MNEAGIDFKIGIADISDADWIADAQIKMAQETENIQLDKNVVQRGVKFLFDHPERGFYVIARDKNDVPAGILLVLKEWSDWRNGDVWWIHSVYVDKPYRRQGIFSRMFQFIEKKGRAEGVRGLRLYVEKENVSAKKVYESLGMTGERYDMYEKMFSDY